MSDDADAGAGRNGAAPEVAGRRPAIVAAHAVTMTISGVVALISLLSIVFGQGPRGSRPLGLAMFAVAAVTVWVAWLSLQTFRRTDHPRLLWMAGVGLGWMAVALVAPTV